MNTSDPVRPIKVLCVDDNAFIGDAFSRRLGQESSLVWLGLVSDGAAVYDAVRERRPDVVLMDIDMPGVDTFGLVDRLSVEFPDVRVLMFSGYVDPTYLERALDCGAWGYLCKNDDVTRIIESIKRVGCGEVVLSKEIEAVERSQAIASQRQE